MRFECIVEIHITVNHIKILNVAQKYLYHVWGHNVAGNCTTYLGLRVEGPIFLFYLSQIWSFSTDLHQSSQYQISGQSVRRELRKHM
jgi:hypothetical protein